MVSHVFNISGYNVLTLYVVLWMSRSISEINAKCLKFVKTCINVIIIYSTQTVHAVLAKTNLGYLNRGKNFFDWGGPRGPPLHTPMVSHIFNIFGHNVNLVCGLVDESIKQ